MRIVFMGTPDFSVPALKAIVEAGHQVTAVVTQPDKPKGRGKDVQMTPVKIQALEYGIPVYQPVKVKTPEFVEITEFRYLPIGYFTESTAKSLLERKSPSLTGFILLHFDS